MKPQLATFSRRKKKPKATYWIAIPGTKGHLLEYIVVYNGKRHPENFNSFGDVQTWLQQQAAGVPPPPAPVKPKRIRK